MSTPEEQAWAYANAEWPTLVDQQRTLKNEPDFVQRDATIEDFLAGYRAAANDAERAVLDLFFALRKIKGTPTLKDLVKLARRIRPSCLPMCIGCCDGADLPDGEWCRACGLNEPETK